MTPKEKAKYLVNEFTFNCKECDNSKQSALVAVDEILFAIQDLMFEDVKWDYWQQVKTEIGNL